MPIARSIKFLKHRPSTLLAFAVWGLTGFMAQPTIVSGVVHLVISPLLLWAVLAVSHWEGRKHVGG